MIGRSKAFRLREGVLEFQFHYGMIGSGGGDKENPLLAVFQFHYGMIGSRGAIVPLLGVHGFNSTMG